jgi:hypothetical protein
MGAAERNHRRALVFLSAMTALLAFSGCSVSPKPVAGNASNPSCARKIIATPPAAFTNDPASTECLDGESVCSRVTGGFEEVWGIDTINLEYYNEHREAVRFTKLVIDHVHRCHFQAREERFFDVWMYNAQFSLADEVTAAHAKYGAHLPDRGRDYPTHSQTIKETLALERYLLADPPAKDSCIPSGAVPL